MHAFFEHLSPGAALGHYTLEERVGRGGHAEVWRARSPDSGGHIALKIMHSREVKDYARFRQEAAVQQRLTHPNIVQVHGLRMVDGYALIEQEFVPGRTLLEWLTRHRPTLELCDAWVLQILDGLAAAHAQGILHRDIKPSNILIDERQHPPRAKLADFGIARVLQDPSAEITAVGMVLGTPGYMAPEQIRGLADVDARADLFGLGSLAYRLLSGRSPFGGGSQYEVFSRTCQGEFPPLAEVAPALPERMVRTVEAALSVRPSARPRDAASFRACWVGDALPDRAEATATLVDALGPPPGDPDRAASPPQTNRRVHADRFFGRGTELAAVGASLAASAHRLVTLKGPGGVGKTRLADEVLARAPQGDWPGGIWRCTLTAARAKGDLVESLRAVLGARLSEAAPLQGLGHALRERGRCLLLLDNLEQIIEPAAEAIETLLQCAPEVVILATSRLPLGLREEFVVEVEALDSKSAVELLLDRAQDLLPSLHPGPEQESLLRGLVERLEGFPLSLELAASRLRVLSLEDLSARLAKGDRVLSRRRRGTESRHSSVEEAIAWSWSLLEPWEQLALAQCSVFRGGFALDAACEVLCLDAFPDSPWEADVLESLVDHSLVRLTRTRDGVRRFELYVSVQDFARAQLARPGAVCSPAGESLTGPSESEHQLWRHASHYAGFGEKKQLSRLQGPRSWPWLQVLVREVPNLTAAHETAAAAASPEHAGWQGCTALALASVFQRTGQTRAALGVLRPAWERSGRSPALRAELGSRLTIVLRQLGDLSQALSVIAATLKSLPAGRLHAHHAKLLQHQGNITRQRGDLPAARRCLEAAMARARAGDAQGLVAQVTGDLGSVSFEAGDYPAAERAYREGLQRHQDLGRDDHANLARGNLGELALARGDLLQARRVFEECIEVARSRGYRRQELIFAVKAARTCLEFGAQSAAAEGFARALALNAHVEDRRRQGQILCGLGELAHRRGDPEAARTHLEEAARLVAALEPRSAGQRGSPRASLGAGRAGGAGTESPAGWLSAPRGGRTPVGTGRVWPGRGGPGCPSGRRASVGGAGWVAPGALLCRPRSGPCDRALVRTPRGAGGSRRMTKGWGEGGPSPTAGRLSLRKESHPRARRCRGSPHLHRRGMRHSQGLRTRWSPRGSRWRSGRR